MDMHRFRKLHGRHLVVLLGLILGGLWTSLNAQTISPASVVASLDPGASLAVDKTVGTPEIPPLPDICFLADTTGSMTDAIADVQDNAEAIMNAVLLVQPEAHFCVAEYRDAGDSPVFAVNQVMTDDTTAVVAAINTWDADGGGDTPEGQLHALTELSSPATAGWRTDSTRIIVWFGDNPGHDPSVGGETLASTIAALVAEEIQVIAVPVETPFNDGLDFSGQATAIVDATGGVLTTETTEVAAAILLALVNLPVDVSMTSDCPATTGGAILTSFVPASITVTSGDPAEFDETITVGPAAIEGQTYTCRDWATLNGAPMTDPATGELVVETKTITINDVTPPTAACTEGPNPAGNVPVAHNQNPDGFYTVIGEDNVGVGSIVICDDASAFCTAPLSSGDTVKITQAPGVTPHEVRPGPDGMVAHIFLNGDAVLTVTDTSGNVTTASCLVPPPPK
jgi:hypothetical protein